MTTTTTIDSADCATKETMNTATPAGDASAPVASLKPVIQLLDQAHSALEGMSDSDLDHFESDEEEIEGAPAQFAARKVMHAMQVLAEIQKDNGRQDQASAQGEMSQTDAHRFARMFMSACEALGAINEALNLDPNDGGAEPILDAILKLQATPVMVPGDKDIANIRLAAVHLKECGFHTAADNLMRIARLSTAVVPARPAAATQAARDVLSERRRQVQLEGYDPTHDDAHPSGELAAMATFYAMPAAVREWPASETGYGTTFGTAVTPEGWVTKTGDRRRELVKAGALILAEIERMDRTSINAKQNGDAQGATA